MDRPPFRAPGHVRCGAASPQVLLDRHRIRHLNKPAPRWDPALKAHRVSSSFRSLQASSKDNGENCSPVRLVLSSLEDREISPRRLLCHW